MPKFVYPPELKLEITKAYISGGKSCRRLSEEYDVSASSIKEWVRRYREYGEDGFLTSEGNRKYTGEFKKKCVEAVLSGEGTVNDIVVRYDISSRSVLRQWIENYHADRELKDYNLNTESSPGKPAKQPGMRPGAAAAGYVVQYQRPGGGVIAELEQLRRENQQLKQQLKEKEKTVALLKKADEFERM